MSRKRLTREDSRELTTTRLLEAAQKLIAKKGLEAASVENIAAAAGYSRGAFYSNFNSKDDLFIELLRRDHLRAMADFNALRSDALPLEHIQARVREIYSGLYQYSDNESFMNWAEARMLAARDTKFRAKLSALLAEKRQQIADFIEYFYRRLGVEPTVPPATLAMGFMSLMDGVTLSMLSNPADMTPAAAKTVLSLFVDSIMQLARLQADASTSDERPDRPVRIGEKRSA
jgi:AcrR family transcriptional regulator